VAVIAVGGDDGVLVADIGLHADHDRFLADIEMAEAADQAHAVELARPLLEAADQQHVAVMRLELVGAHAVVAQIGRRLRLGGRRIVFRLRGRLRHGSPLMNALRLIASLRAMYLI
jgi:hypothetical protein